MNQKIHRVGSREEWRCQACSFDNSILLTNCQVCEAKRPDKFNKKAEDVIKQQTSHTVIKKTIICLNLSCKTQNDINQIKCKKCGNFLVQGLDEDEQYDQDYEQQKGSSKKKQQKVQMAICHKCKFQNHPANVTCVNCEIRMKKKRAPKLPKVRAPRYYGPNYCTVCNSYKAYSNGEYECHCPDEDDGITLQKSLCNYCFENLLPGKYDEHVQNCKQKQKFYSNKQNKSYERCTDLQIETMIYMHKKCEKLHFAKQIKLTKRIQKLGYTKKDLQNLYHYVVNYAPIIIHMHANTHFQFFVKDTHYRSQFETSKSSGSLSRSARTTWQDRMFDNKHHNAKDSERVKYGTMNFTNDPQGVAVCVGYGQSYFLLKQHVRDRCTMTDMDSSSPSATICTFRFCYHLLSRLSDIQIKSAFQGSKAQQIKSAGVIGAYKQIQIHGPVQFKKDIERVYISKAQIALNPKCFDEVKQFCQKNGLDYQLFGEVPKPPPPPVFGGVGAPFGSFGGGSLFSAGHPGVAVGGLFGYSGFGAHVMFPPRKPPKHLIKYTQVRFPYSKPKGDEQQDEQQDYI